MKKKSTALSSMSLVSKPQETETISAETTTDAPGSEKKQHSLLLKIDKADYKRLAQFALDEETSVTKSIREAIQLFFAEKGI